MTLLQPLKLLLPAIIPSWNFFDIITASPRIQFILLQTKNEKHTEKDWQEFRPRPATLSFIQMLQRMLWNPQWNEALFLVSCAERIMDPSMQDKIQHSENEILKRIENELRHNSAPSPVTTYLQFRLLYVRRHAADLQQEVTFYSRIHKLSHKELT
jgi:hypothetical protein